MFSWTKYGPYKRAPLFTISEALGAVGFLNAMLLR